MIDAQLMELRGKVLAGMVGDFSISETGLLRFQGRICVPADDSIRREILDEAHTTPYLIKKARSYYELHGGHPYGCIAFFTTEGICHHIGLSRMVMDFTIIILYKLQPSSLPHIQLHLSEEVFEALVVSLYLTLLAIKIVPPNL